MSFLRFFQWRRPTVDVTNEAFSQWLRAQRPPWAWFLALSELEREQLALLGDEYVRDVIVSLGYAVADPTLAEASVELESGRGSGDAVFAQRLAEKLARRIAETRRNGGSEPHTTRSDAPEGFAGFGRRRAGADTEPPEGRSPGAAFFGRPPDEGGTSP